MLRKQILLLGNKNCFCHGVKNIFASLTQMLRPKHMFPSLATPGDITRNIVSATMFPSLARPLWLLRYVWTQSDNRDVNTTDCDSKRALIKQKAVVYYAMKCN